MNVTMMRPAAWMFVLVGMASAQPTVRAALEAPGGRKPAPNFELKDASGKTAQLKKYHGKVILVDFWATWCTGCKQEIPWFTEFQKTYRKKGFEVVGVSLDEDGWKVLRPFLNEHQIPYRMVLGDKATAKLYGIESMPDTFLIDRKGKVAAAYRAGLVDRENIESNIKQLVGER